MWHIEWMRLLGKEVKVKELDYYKTKQGSTLSLQEVGNGMKWSVALYSKSDIEEWTKDFASYSEAWNYFDKKRHEDRHGPIAESGAKR